MTVKLALLKSGEDVIADWREIVLEDKEKVAAYLAGYPYVVKINKTDIPNADEPAKVSLSYFPWMPLSKEDTIPITSDWVITIVEPMIKLKDMYLEDIVNYGNQSNSSDNDSAGSDQSD